MNNVIHELITLLSKLWPIVITAAGGVLAWVQWSFGRKFATRTDLSEAWDRIRFNEREIAIFKKELSHMPTNKDIADLKEIIAKQSEIIAAQGAISKATNESVLRLEGFFLEKGTKE